MKKKLIALLMVFSISSSSFAIEPLWGSVLLALFYGGATSYSAYTLTWEKSQLEDSLLRDIQEFDMTGAETQLLIDAAATQQITDPSEREDFYQRLLAELN